MLKRDAKRFAVFPRTHGRTDAEQIAWSARVNCLAEAARFYDDLAASCAAAPWGVAEGTGQLSKLLNPPRYLRRRDKMMECRGSNPLAPASKSLFLRDFAVWHEMRANTGHVWRAALSPYRKIEDEARISASVSVGQFWYLPDVRRRRISSDPTLLIAAHGSDDIRLAARYFPVLVEKRATKASVP